jgi:hypothetical protein
MKKIMAAKVAIIRCTEAVEKVLQKNLKKNLEN